MRIKPMQVAQIRNEQYCISLILSSFFVLTGSRYIDLPCSIVPILKEIFCPGPYHAHQDKERREGPGVMILNDTRGERILVMKVSITGSGNMGSGLAHCKHGPGTML